ncbi:AAA domain-containing protein [Clostridium brassicae]|uniref:AAA domain-containing protein n=1 Tax=Clostridium brassicae TaxID=2999072 RepID=A0ABT4DC33_9CLOT|nr:AAA domain-containing protein [Clostridium brassicae]MCY6959223.1 AAA domain-containing protein [Clostridium brassicae]
MDYKEKFKNVVYYLLNVRKMKFGKNNKSTGRENEEIQCKKWEQELNNIINEVDENGVIPNSIRALVEDNTDYENKDFNEWQESIEEILFPLPYSQAQKEVVKKIGKSFGVVIEGGPGTGKSQTIVNLICHFLAHNKRVLVTSQSDKSLKMLFKKIPEDIKPLCMSIIDNNSEEMKEVEYSIRKITENISLDGNKLYKETKYLQNELNKCSDRQKQLYDNLQRAEKIENGTVKYGGKYYKLLNIAKWLKENEKQYSWIEDEIKPRQKCPMTDAKFSKLVYLLSNSQKEEIIQFSRMESFLYNIPSTLEVVSNMEKFIYLKSNYNKYITILKDWCVSYNVDYNYGRVIHILESTEKFLNDIEGTWLENILQSSHQSETVRVVLDHMILRCNFYIKKICSIIKEINCHYVEIPNAIDVMYLSQKLQVICKQYEQKGKVNRLFRVLHPECEDILQKCKVDGKLIQSKEQAQIAIKYVEQKYVEECLKKLWNSSVNVYKGEEIDEIDLTVLSQLEDTINKLDTLINWDNIVKNKVAIAMRNIAFLNDMDWYKKETYIHLKQGMLSIKCLNEYENIKTYLINLKSTISQIGGFKEIVQAIDSCDVKLLKSAYEKLDRLKEKAPKLKEINILIEQIGECPKLIDKMLRDEDKLNMLVKYKNFSIAWKWKQFDYMLDKAHQFEINDIEDKIEVEKNNESKLIEEIVVKKAWNNELHNIGEMEKRSLYACLDAFKKVGKGKGIHSDMYKKLASRELEVCKSVIPVWIMPLENVIENLPVYGNEFDVVIIDEGSQCDIFAISALFRAKKAIIIGDDNQITPEAIGTNTCKTQTLIDKYLKDIPHSEWFDMKTSLYSTALRIFPDRIMLKEHFRCVPEVIGFSNELCYSNEIIPLRQSNSVERLGLPVKAIRVHGERDVTKPINYNEAEAIVSKISEYCRNPKYKGMTMGVISLLGDAQSELIESILKNKIGNKEISERKIICGNAYSFQGDERDIIFLSMVVSNNVKFSTLTKESDIRRFNVAASRAKNKMLLFHSVDLKDLNPECVRSKLLSYCININNNKHMDLKNILESQFQKDVYRMIKENGYEVKPQVIVGEYKIDFVIEGVNHKIAIDCNGDKESKIENWEEEYNKQVCLQRMGWRFLKINGSEFYRNPEETMDKLCRKIRNIDVDSGIA